eukprot:1152023-Pelagomonas_calceolata.AAC.4
MVTAGGVGTAAIQMAKSQRDALNTRNLIHAPFEKKRKVYAGHRPRALRKGPLTSKLARASPECTICRVLLWSPRAPAGPWICAAS